LAGITGDTFAVLVNNPIDAIKPYKLRICRVAPLHGFTFFRYDWLKEKFN